jgi:ribosomal protein S4E
VWRRNEIHTGFWWGKVREGDYVKDLTVDGKILLKWIFKKKDGFMDWINLAQDRKRWRVLVNAIMKFRVT